MERGRLDKIEKQVLGIMQGEVADTISATRKNMIVLEEKESGDSATVADIKIGNIFDSELPRLLPGSIVIQEESFDEQVYKRALQSKYIWVVDPIDGTRAFREPENKEWCVGVCLLEDLNPVLSFVYIPEPWLYDRPLLLSANAHRGGVANYGVRFHGRIDRKNLHYVSHIHSDTQRNQTENKIAQLFENNKIIRAYSGNSTLAQIASVAVDVGNKVFTRRGANIWDIIQGAFLVQKVGGEVFYENGQNIFPLDLSLLKFENNLLIMPFTIACSKQNKNMILKFLTTTI